ncbi:MAG: MBL fold metallo-hydrolase [Candidatus Peregrinibacteria bacterium]
MEIKFHGKNCFTVKDQKITVALDPHDKGLSANAVALSQADEEHKISKLVAGEPKVFDWPGEYETLGVHFHGIHSFRDPKESKIQRENTVFHITMNGIRLCHLGNQGTKLTPQQLEQVGDVDVLFVPVGGKDAADAKKAKEIVEQIEPRVVIPMGYDSPAEFLSAMGAKAVEPLENFTFKKTELPEDTTRVIVLTAA